ncbi:hypothetical protein BDP27DRAFT_1421105 [Rhodocollybia butyracea]|uniref:Uncharacterized protein n=1 Tax=Rhodocollybia butyracea TaxID=206335 RepID=A0A9P5U7X6_9AGAR|nr:hypothetical protein BDP27DRAFT_1421105 [Rhodocollybia butyracea]
MKPASQLYSIAEWKEGELTEAVLALAAAASTSAESTPVNKDTETAVVRARPSAQQAFRGVRQDARGQIVLKGDAAFMRKKSAKKEKRIEEAQSEMKLADLIKPGSIRESWNYKDSEIEVIPAVRTLFCHCPGRTCIYAGHASATRRTSNIVYHSDGDRYDSSTADPNLTYAKVVLHGLD